MAPTATTHQIGNTRITRIQELGWDNKPPADLYPDWQPSDAAATDLQGLMPTDLSTDGTALSQSIHGWLVQSPTHTMLVDTAVGNHKTRPVQAGFHRLDSDFLAQLATVGVAPEEIDTVLLTHLHVDHVGWNTRWAGGRWIPTFPNARYIFNDDEYRYYAERANRSAGSDHAFDDSVAPIVAAGQAQMVAADGHEVMDGVIFHATPGHSAHHASIELSCGEEIAFFGGDVLHTPLQVHRPTWNTVFCENGPAAAASRRWALDYVAARNAVYFSSHFAGSSAGRISGNSHGRTWRYV